MKLTKNDRLILDSYSVMLKGLSDYLGLSFEIILHSLEDYHHSVIGIYNGFHSGRHIGAPITDLALKMLEKIENGGKDINRSYSAYFITKENGQHLKSSTIPVLGDNNRIIGLVCINMYLDSPLYQFITELKESEGQEIQNETYASDVNDMITAAVNTTKTKIFFDPNIPPANKNKELIRVLNNQGIFNLKDAVIHVAETLGISKNTVYMHLRNIKEEQS